MKNNIVSAIVTEVENRYKNEELTELKKDYQVCSRLAYATSCYFINMDSCNYEDKEIFDNLEDAIQYIEVLKTMINDLENKHNTKFDCIRTNYINYIEKISKNLIEEGIPPL